ncbi:hypothetical protein WICPIJ_004394 [Wickerhamomyces pijperi]|uniref:Uncharacterized protein n=1 Tax=Wickerhamomyces pijperi TaxID=599730 RepID=A0A9P8Q5Q6_WICPI|nr:hypothetical protein WICPIJ_004394 [Wickerhamomyces pijperi]
MLISTSSILASLRQPNRTCKPLLFRNTSWDLLLTVNAFTRNDKAKSMMYLSFFDSWMSKRIHFKDIEPNSFLQYVGLAIKGSRKTRASTFRTTLYGAEKSYPLYFKNKSRNFLLRLVFNSTFLTLRMVERIWYPLIVSNSSINFQLEEANLRMVSVAWKRVSKSLDDSIAWNIGGKGDRAYRSSDISRDS